MLSSIVQPFGTMVIGLDLARRVMRATQGFRSLRPLMRDLAVVILRRFSSRFTLVASSETIGQSLPPSARKSLYGSTNNSAVFSDLLSIDRLS